MTGSPDYWIYNLGDWMLFAGMCAVLITTVVYGLRSTWWRYPEGRALFSKSASLAGISGLSVLYLWIGDYEGRGIIRALVYGAFAVSSWWFLFVIVREQHRDRVKQDGLRRELAEAQAREALDKLGHHHNTDPVPVRIVRVPPRKSWRHWFRRRV